jgi:hypothetical protein
MRDVVFLTAVIAFFALAVVFVRGCELVLGRWSPLEEDGRP